MSDASVNRGGGSVKCWLGVTSTMLVTSPALSGGSERSASSAPSSWPSV